MIRNDSILKVTAAVAAEIKELRLEKDLSALKLGEYAGLSHQTIGYIESGKRKPTLESLIRICKAMDIPLAELFVRVEKKIIRST